MLNGFILGQLVLTFINSYLFSIGTSIGLVYYTYFLLLLVFFS